jgi:hypothetical protein
MISDSEIAVFYADKVLVCDQLLDSDALLKYKNVILTPRTAPGTRQNGMKDVDEMCFKMWRRLK